MQQLFANVLTIRVVQIKENADSRIGEKFKGEAGTICLWEKAYRVFDQPFFYHQQSKKPG
ncbi:hypothetical protein P6N53_07310 [Desulforamulus aquiferis]|uniref:Transposase n=1 Tax=Desulforamulus aquiferis TaxID=1397668 RepID=A0AAW7ZC95_9FIRM|nr:hypothetical protein [Desulforamulus aquiferis]